MINDSENNRILLEYVCRNHFLKFYIIIMERCNNYRKCRMCKNKRWICNFIVLFILISGMWVDEVKADSIFLSLKTQMFSVQENFVQEISADDVLKQEMPSAVLSDIAVESTEILCSRNVVSSRQISAHLIYSKRVVKLSMIFLCMVIFAFLLSNFYTTEQVMDDKIQDTQTVVLNYIHNIDGKKEVSLFC